MSKQGMPHHHTAPPGTAPFVVVIHLGPARHCVNFCGYLERSGFQSLCGDRFARAPEELASFVIPDAIVVRVSEHPRPDTVRPEFECLAALRHGFPDAPIMIVVEGAQTTTERELAATQSVRIFNRKVRGYASLLRALRASTAAASPDQSTT